MHFQGWKRLYYTYTTRLPSSNSNTLIATETGFIPFISKNSHSGFGVINSDFRTVLESGKISFGDLLDAMGSNRKNGDSTSYRGKLLPKFANGFHTHYCGGFSEDLKRCICRIRGDQIYVIQVAKASIASDDITFISTGWSDDYYEKKLDSMLDSWKGNKVLGCSSYIDLT